MRQLTSQNARTINQDPHTDTPPLMFDRVCLFFQEREKAFFLVRCTLYAFDLVTGGIDGIPQLLLIQRLLRVDHGLPFGLRGCDLFYLRKFPIV